jgi:hypothetical protein
LQRNVAFNTLTITFRGKNIPRKQRAMVVYSDSEHANNYTIDAAGMMQILYQYIYGYNIFIYISIGQKMAILFILQRNVAFNTLTITFRGKNIPRKQRAMVVYSDSDD